MKTIFALALFATSIVSPLFTASAIAAPSRDSVYVGRQDVGSDPDANVRFDLQHRQNLAKPPRSDPRSMQRADVPLVQPL